MYLIKSQSVFQFITLLIVFIIVLAATYFTTRWIANYQKGASISGNIEVIEVRRITNTKSIEIIRIGEEYFALAIGKDEINLIGRLNKEQLNLDKTVKNSTGQSFKLILNKMKKNSNDELLQNSGNDEGNNIEDVNTEVINTEDDSNEDREHIINKDIE